jgi:hypothetical protein
MARWFQSIRPRSTLHLATSSLEAVTIVGRALLPSVEEARRSFQNGWSRREHACAQRDQRPNTPQER